MELHSATLFLLSGKIASGKSTLAKKLAAENNAILVSQDEWLSTLYPGEINTLEDYSKYFTRLAKAVEGIISDILKSGIPVVLDFPANTTKVRSWMSGIVSSSGCKHELHFLDIPDSVCLTRLKARNEIGLHEYKVTEREFKQFSSYFVAPLPDEQFNVIVHGSID